MIMVISCRLGGHDCGQHANITGEDLELAQTYQLDGKKSALSETSVLMPRGYLPVQCPFLNYRFICFQHLLLFSLFLKERTVFFSVFTAFVSFPTRLSRHMLTFVANYSMFQVHHQKVGTIYPGMNTLPLHYQQVQTTAEYSILPKFTISFHQIYLYHQVSIFQVGFGGMMICMMMILVPSDIAPRANSHTIDVVLGKMNICMI